MELRMRSAASRRRARSARSGSSRPRGRIPGLAERPMPTGCMATMPGLCRWWREVFSSLRTPGRRRDLKLTSVQRGQAFRLRDVVYGLGVEEWVERRCQPCHGGKPEACSPAVDLPDVFDDKRVTQLFA